MHIVSIGGQIENRKAKVPVALYANVGFIYSYWTMIDDSVYSKRNEYGSNGNSRADKYTSFHFVDNDEYPVRCSDYSWNQALEVVTSEKNKNPKF